MRKNKKINIIYKDEQIVVCEKPKGIPVSSDKTGDMDLLHQLKNQLFFEENTDGEPELYLVHRLDRPVGGVMVFARTKQAAASLTEQIKDHTFEKDYQAVLTGWLPDDEGTFRDFLLKDPKNNVSKVVKEGTKGAKEAILDYEVIDMMEDSKMKYTYCLIHLETGRHHQIRVQTSSRGLESGEIQSIIQFIRRQRRNTKRSDCSQQGLHLTIQRHMREWYLRQIQVGKHLTY